MNRLTGSHRLRAESWMGLGNACGGHAAERGVLGIDGALQRVQSHRRTVHGARGGRRPAFVLVLGLSSEWILLV